MSSPPTTVRPSRVIRALRGPTSGAPRAFLVRWAILRGLAVVYLIAFTDLWRQLAGLLGSHGVMPARAFLEDNHTGAFERLFRVPTVFWLDASDGALHAACAAGVLLSVLLFLRLAPTLVLMALWALYLSFVSVGQELYQYQWDRLLLEAGFAAIFLSPWLGQPALEDEPPPSPWILWALRVLTVRVMISSGLLKLLHGNEPWHDLTALHFHFWTQPLPTWTAWLADKLPDGVLSAGVVLTLVIQGPIALCGLGPRRLRLLAFVALVLHQTLIFATGNFTWFNLLSLVLCLSLLDDDYLARALPRALVRAAARERPPPPASQRRLIAGVAVFVLALQLVQTMFSFGVGDLVPRPVAKAFGRARGLGVVSGYGLFISMTTERPEIVLEGSHDGRTWLPYELPVKPGALDRAPSFVAPFQARLDWQLWFAALGDVRWEPWVPALMRHLSAGTPEVIALFAHDPFAGAPPRYVRATYWNYRFASWDEWSRTGEFWRRTRRGDGIYAATIDGGPR